VKNLVIFNTLSGKKEEFKSIAPGQVKMYCCGPTVYDQLHVGNFRGPVFYNFLKNWLEKLNYKVTYAYNFTDIDDKILNRCRDENREFNEVITTYIEAFWNDFNNLKLKPHDLNPRVTENLDSIIQVIDELIKNNAAYEVHGEVFFSIENFKEYGKLSNRKPEDMISGSRVEPDPNKRNPLDFSLWKPAKDGEISWPSPWGAGRPGWHIECTAMIFKHLGSQIDIHGGGMDLVFPHHENEIAQGEACSHKTYANYWVHNNMFTFAGAKMSKSLGNVRTMKNFLEEYHPEVFKYLVLSSHYRSQTEFSEKTILNSISGLCRIYESLKNADDYLLKPSTVKPSKMVDDFEVVLKNLELQIHEAYNDDFNTAKGMSYIFEAVRQYNTLCPTGAAKNADRYYISLSFKNYILELGKDLSLFQDPALDFLKSIDQILIQKLDIDEKKINALMEDRKIAKQNKDYKKSDEIRDMLITMRILVKDTPTGSVWEVDKKFIE
jgi:cysteinyl-tRNA synthetase